MVTAAIAMGILALGALVVVAWGFDWAEGSDDAVDKSEPDDDGRRRDDA
ncbi:hypothetical protein [Amycolatopsis sp. H20-H5]|nr:hypothetical protein [Amycolatopsis sp. H20-H5]MEC3978611.1 hypothetical protein [Amycolatopsis sp. H20-H5]